MRIRAYRNTRTVTPSVVWIVGLLIFQRNKFALFRHGVLAIIDTGTNTNARTAFLLPFYKRSHTRACYEYGHHESRLDARLLNMARDESSETSTDSSPSSSRSLPPIPDPATNSDDNFFRSFHERVPKRVQSWMRDSGIVRGIMDLMVWPAIPRLIQDYPWAAYDFFRLTTPSNGNSAGMTKRVVGMIWDRQEDSKGLKSGMELTVEKHVYGIHKRQFVSLISSLTDDASSLDKSINKKPRLNKQRVIVVVHGGAWGSGFPNMYALMATPFLNDGYSHVALVGYRTFPTADLKGQLDDISKGLETISRLTNHTKITVIGHSSGSHLLSMAFLEGRLPLDNIDQYVGMAGVYDIPSHYRFERKRGIQRISPMAGACGYTLQNWKCSSPLQILQAADKIQQNTMLGRFPSSTILLHGGLDTTVPYTSTKKFAEASGLDWHLLQDAGHTDMVLHMMFGDGNTQDTILKWIHENQAFD